MTRTTLKLCRYRISVALHPEALEDVLWELNHGCYLRIPLAINLFEVLAELGKALISRGYDGCYDRRHI